MIVLDTNVVSELMRPDPQQGVVSWLLEQRSEEQLVTTSITVAEISYGIARLPLGRRRSDLEAASEAVFSRFAGTILAFDVMAARAYADLVSHRESVGSPISGFDAQIAAMCRGKGATLATRNLKDFHETGVRAVSPWDGMTQLG